MTLYDLYMNIISHSRVCVTITITHNRLGNRHFRNINKKSVSIKIPGCDHSCGKFKFKLWLALRFLQNICIIVCTDL